MDEQTLVLNDLLCYMASNISVIERGELIRNIQKFYSKDYIKEARDTLLESLPIKKSTRQARKVKRKDLTTEIYDCISLVQENELPLFVCRDLNNVPNDENLDDDSDEEDFDFETENKNMRFEIKKLEALSSELKEQLQNVIQNNKLSNSAAKNDSSEYCVSVSDASSMKEDDEDADSIDQNDSSPLDNNEFDYPDAFEELEELDDNWQGKNCEIHEVDQNNEVSSKENFTQHAPSPNEEVTWMEDTPTCEEKSIVLMSDEQIDLPTDTINPNTFKDSSSNEDFSHPEVTHTVLEESSIVISIPGSNQCSICGELLRDKNEQHSHFNSHIIENSFQCIICNDEFESRDLLQEHFHHCFLNTKDKLKNNTCSVCGRMYGNKISLKKHSYIHCKSKPFACTQCSYRFLSKKALDSHVHTIHNSLNKYPCPFCHHTYISTSYLRSHIRTHTGEKPFTCSICNYSTSLRDILVRHMKRHGPKEEVKCQLCDFTCLGEEKLKKHKLQKHKKKYIKCTVCKKEFNNPVAYNRHYMLHTGEKPFKCPMCPYAGISSLVLRNHMKVHGGDNPLKCPECEIPFRTNYSFKKHLKTHSADS